MPPDLSPAAVQLLLSRGIADAATLEHFLNPPGVPYDPGSLAGISDALPRLAAAARDRETVAVFGDFDVDGITGTAILCETLDRLGCRVIPYLPDPVSEGHGMNAGAVEKLAAQGATLMVTVDCGVSDAAEVALARVGPADRAAFVGAGALPITALHPVNCFNSCDCLTVFIKNLLQTFKSKKFQYRPECQSGASNPIRSCN